MNLRALLRIVGLRYRLLWAHVRSKQGRVVLFFCAYLLVVPIAIILAAGGLGAGLAAVRSGKSEMIAGTLLGGVYLEAILMSLLLGMGSVPAFSDVALRRYPLSRLDRMGARQLTAFLEPIWLLVLALDLGVAVGFYVFLGARLLWLAVPAALLLVVTNFLLARVLSVLTGWILSRRGGAVALMIGVFLLFGAVAWVPGLAHSAAWWKQGLEPLLLAGLRFTPPFIAASVFVGVSARVSFFGLLGLVLWCLVFIALLAFVEGLPSGSPSVAGVRTVWRGPCDRVAGAFGSGVAPLVGKALRYYVRSPQLWLNYPFAAIFPTVLAFQLSRHQRDPLSGFLAMLGVISSVGFLSMGAMTMNAFGFDQSGFRRYFILPVAPAVVFRAIAIVPLVFGGLLIPISLGLWRFFWHGRLDTHMVVMLFASGFGGMFLFQALGLWTSLLTPRAMDFKIKFGNKLSFAQNALMGVGILFMLGLPAVFLNLGSSAVLPHGWVLLVMMVAAACFYFVTLRAGARVFSARRERILSMIERGY